MASEIYKIAQEVTHKSTPEKAVSYALTFYIQQKIKEYELKIKILKEKYHTDFEDFKEKLGTKFDLSWEHEKDYMDWEEAITNIKYFKQVLKKLA
ncbi:MAG: hypothetical protein ACE5KE_06005 [Methanosarcinales archaeon]